MLEVFKATWQTVWAEQWQYRANLLTYLLYWLVAPNVYLAVWASIARAQGSVNGLTEADFTAYYMVLFLINVLTSDNTIYVFAYKVHDGSLSGDLLMPVHPMLVRPLITNLGYKLLHIIMFVPAWIVLLLIFQPRLTLTVESVLLTAVAVVLGFAVEFLTGAIISTIAFWTTRVYSLDALRFVINAILSGEFVPLDLLPGALQQVAQVLPFQLSLYFPIMLLLNRVPPERIALNFGLLLFWLVALGLAFAGLWRIALRRYSAVGA